MVYVVIGVGIGCFVLGAMFGGVFVHLAHSVASQLQAVRAEATKLSGEALNLISHKG